MQMPYTHHKNQRIRNRVKLLPVLILALITIAGTFNKAAAQRFNLSDWNVPPPLPPGNQTKGAATGKEAKGKPIVLTPVNIPATALPDTRAVQLPFLAAISTTPPIVKVPDQPYILAAEAGLPEIPLPGAPDVTELPKQSPQDDPVQLIADLPVPEAPEMPPFPGEPTSSGQAATVKVPIPVMPDVVNLPSPSLPSNSSLPGWPTPVIPENASIKLIVPAEKKGVSSGGKGTKKVKAKRIKN